MIATERLTGLATTKKETVQIISKATGASNTLQCPYRVNTVRHSIWLTAFKCRNKGISQERVYEALLAAGIPCNRGQANAKENV